MKKSVFALCALWLLVACSAIECPIQTEVLTRYGFYDADNQPYTLEDTLWVWTQRRDGTDTLLFNRGVNQTDLSLPISYQHPEDMLVFCMIDTLHIMRLDTVWVQKEDIPHFESVDCAAHFFHTLTAVRSTHYSIDSVTISNTSVNYDNMSGEHLRVYFKTRR